MSTRILRCLVVGDSCGKTSLLKQLIDRRFNTCTPTSVVDVHFWQIEINHSPIEIVYLDMPAVLPPETYPSCYEDVDVIFYCYDITNKNSFECLDKLNQTMDSHIKKRPNKILIGNKTDLCEKRAVEQIYAQQFCEKNKFKAFYETSAKNHTEVKALFTKVITNAGTTLTHKSLINASESQQNAIPSTAPLSLEEIIATIKKDLMPKGSLENRVGFGGGELVVVDDQTYKLAKGAATMLKSVLENKEGDDLIIAWYGALIEAMARSNSIRTLFARQDEVNTFYRDSLGLIERYYKNNQLPLPAPAIKQRCC